MSWAGRHRGPDDEGSVTLPGVALAHRRLSIIDLTAAGHQPMPDATGRYWIVFNGEIYNYIEIRDELKAGGHEFRTRTDTEVVLEAYNRWGSQCLNRMNGMWAFAIADSRNGALFLARDRFGVKPLSYVLRPGLFAFASELKQLLAGLDGRWSVERDTAADFFFWGVQDHTDKNFIDGVFQLPAGHYLEIGAPEIECGRVTPRRYWTPEEGPSISGGDAVDRFRDLFEDAVRLRLRSDVPLGITLSGGLDSSSIACVAARLQPAGTVSARIQAFTAVFDDPGYSEEGHAQSVATSTGMRSIVIRPGRTTLVTDWPEFIACMEEPFASLSFYANWKVYEKIREYAVPVILTGQGGDELLLGYPRYRVTFLSYLLKSRRFLDALRESILSKRSGGISLSTLAAYFAYFRNPRLRIARRLSLMKPFVTREFFSHAESRTESVLDAAARSDIGDLLSKEFERYQLPHLLHHEDRVSMHFAIESRSPFLDYRLYQCVLGLGFDSLIHDGWSKWVLRRAMRGVLLESIRLRTVKIGYDTPTGSLLREGAPVFNELLDRNEDDALLNIGAVRRGLNAGGMDENTLCRALSYLSWRERYGVHL